MISDVWSSTPSLVSQPILATRRWIFRSMFMYSNYTCTTILCTHTCAHAHIASIQYAHFISTYSHTRICMLTYSNSSLRITWHQFARDALNVRLSMTPYHHQATLRSSLCTHPIANTGYWVITKYTCIMHAYTYMYMELQLAHILLIPRRKTIVV